MPCLAEVLFIIGCSVQLGFLPLYEWFPSTYGSGNGRSGAIVSGAVRPPELLSEAGWISADDHPRIGPALVNETKRRQLLCVSCNSRWRRVRLLGPLRHDQLRISIDLPLVIEFSDTPKVVDAAHSSCWIRGLSRSIF